MERKEESKRERESSIQGQWLSEIVKTIFCDVKLKRTKIAFFCRLRNCFASNDPMRNPFFKWVNPGLFSFIFVSNKQKHYNSYNK